MNVCLAHVLSTDQSKINLFAHLSFSIELLTTEKQKKCTSIIEEAYGNRRIKRMGRKE